MENTTLPAHHSVQSYQDKTLDLLITETFEAHSGFKYILGEKKCGELTIQTAIAKGIGISYLAGFKVLFHDRVVAEEACQNVPYTRDRVRQVVGDKLISSLAAMLKRKELNNSSMEVITQKVNQLLDEAYYEDSDDASLSLLDAWGIDTHPK
jgi:hypothetical protein